MIDSLVEPIRALAVYVDALPASIAFRESIYVSPYTTVTHVVSVGAFAGLILVMDLRLLGVAFREVPFSQVQQRLFPFQMVAFAAAVLSGIALTFGYPLRWLPNLLFWTKMCMLLVAGINAWAFEVVTARSVPDWDTAVRTPYAARVAGGVSIALWLGVIVSGRLMPYLATWFPQR